MKNGWFQHSTKAGLVKSGFADETVWCNCLVAAQDLWCKTSHSVASFGTSGHWQNAKHHCCMLFKQRQSRVKKKDVDQARKSRDKDGSQTSCSGCSFFSGYRLEEDQMDGRCDSPSPALRKHVFGLVIVWRRRQVHPGVKCGKAGWSKNCQVGKPGNIGW